MIISAASGARGLLINVDTNQPLRKARWADLATGEYEAEVLGPNGDSVRDPVTGKVKTYRGRARLKFIPTANLPAPQGRTPAPGEDAEALRRLPKRITAPLFSDRCSRKGCTRLAEWSVSDEVELPPVTRLATRRGVTGLWACRRGKVISRRFYCSFCYRPPRLLDGRGDVIKEFEEAGGVRPQ